MREYIVNRFTGQVLKDLTDFSPDNIPENYAALNEAPVDQYVWDENGYKPPVMARLGWNQEGLHLLMYAKEPSVRGEIAQMGGRVCTDSCMEFFINPFPEHSSDYLNFEVNCIGTMLLGLGAGRHNRFHMAIPLLHMDIRTTLSSAAAHKGGWWALSYAVPARFIEDTYGQKLQPGLVMRGNFYKCADLYEFPHYGSWNPVQNPTPDFHRPESFGKLILGE